VTAELENHPHQRRGKQEDSSAELKMSPAQTAANDAFNFLSQGGIIQHFNIGQRDIVLGFPNAESYNGDAHPFFGENIGRVANRISNARIDNLNGQSYELYANNGPHTVHGGRQGWGKKFFDGPHRVQRNGRNAVVFTYRSSHGEEGFPGTVDFRLWYYPSVELVDGKTKTTLEIEYEAELVGDEVAETVVSLTNHR
jgi:aldose 1-epimerase